MCDLLFVSDFHHTKYSHDPFFNLICEASVTQIAEPDEDKRRKILQTNIPYKHRFKKFSKQQLAIC